MAVLVCGLVLSVLGAGAQGTFQNLGFERAVLTSYLVNPGSGFYGTNATLPNWQWSPQTTFGIGDPSTNVVFNNVAISSAAVSLHGTGSRYAPLINGNYSLFLQGGEGVYGYTGASIYQTALIPIFSRTLFFLGGPSLQVSFNGQSLTPFALSNAATHTYWAADISAYANQSGELRFSVPMNSSSLLDDIRISQTVIPEPGVLMLAALFMVCAVGFWRR